MMAFTNVRFTPQPWVDIVGVIGFTYATAAIANGNAMFYIDDQVDNIGTTYWLSIPETFAWHYGFLFASTGFLLEL